MAIQIPDAALLDWLLRSSWQASILAAVIFCVQQLLKKFLPANMIALLWLLLIAKLLLPVTPQSDLSLFNYLNLDRLQLLFAEQPAAGETDFRGLAAGQASPFAPTEENRPETAAAQAALSWKTAALMTWLAVVIVLALRMAWRHFKLLSQTRRLRPVVDSKMLDQLEDCKAELDLHVPVSLVLTDKVSSPAILGFIRPRLLLPANIIRSLDDEELRHVFLHELAHIKRKDVVVNWLITGLQIVHWFNPFLWLAFSRMRADVEIACDDLALMNPQRSERNAYGRTIIKMLELTSSMSPVPGAIGIMEDRSYMRRRIANLNRGRRISRRPALIAVALILLLSSTVLTDRRPSSGVTILDRLQAAYQRGDLAGIMACFRDDARFHEIGEHDQTLFSGDRNAIEQHYRMSLTYNAHFNFREVEVNGDTVRFAASFRSENFEVVGLYELEGTGTFIMKAGQIQTAYWREQPSLKKKRLEVFDQFLSWLKAERQEDYARLFGQDLFVRYRASGDEVNQLFFEWIASHTQTVTERKGLDMSELPEVKRITTDEEIITVCKEFFGPYENAPQYVTEVQNHLNEKEIPFEQYRVIGVYFDDPNEEDKEKLRSFQGAVVNQEAEVESPYFVYKLKKGEYLYTKVKGDLFEVIPAGYMALFNHMGLKKIKAGSSGGHQIVSMENGEVVCEIYLEIDE